MKNSEIKGLTVEELREKINTEVSGLQKLNFAHAISPIENPMKIRHSKRLIARLRTELRAKELAN
ncbi:MAG: 50S ribosomal protein L29 [Cytophagia bacterium]|nr:50S ribosomal protein L29 [Cytophagia bacterium]NVK85549.1 50S ribosomal protein L29 [Cytophagia bacterium]